MNIFRFIILLYLIHIKYTIEIKPYLYLIDKEKN